MDMTRNEKSLLLYLETRAVDNGGKVDVRCMNKEDMETAKHWNDDGFVKFGRLGSSYICKPDKTSKSTHFVVLSDAAWETVHQLRQKRADRVLSKRDWETAEECRTGEKTELQPV